jgi:PelA/Pel-15E family pectate lyase
MRYLGRLAGVTKDAKHIKSYLKGLDYILDAQYDNGGWPQSHPPGEGYGRYITFNDGAMARIMFVLDEIRKKPQQYAFIPADKRQAVQAAWNRGIQCILKCQVKVDGTLTAWCSQHDDKDFSPRPARTFEPVALTASESIGIVHVLMAVEKPGPEIIAAVDATRDYLDKVKLSGIRIEDKPTEGTPRGFERYVIEDPSAPPQWARFYEIGTDKPVFADRDGVVKYKLSEIGIERRTGYKWYGTWPRAFLTTEYPEWRKKVSGEARR